LQASKDYQLLELGYDPWGATELATRLLNEHDIQMVEVRQGSKTMEKEESDYLGTDFQGLAGKTLTIRVDVYDDAGRTGFAETAIAVTEPKPEEEKIPVEIRSDRETIDEDGSTDLTAFATPYADSGKMTYFWDESPSASPTNVLRLRAVITRIQKGFSFRPLIRRSFRART